MRQLQQLRRWPKCPTSRLAPACPIPGFGISRPASSSCHAWFYIVVIILAVDSVFDHVMFCTKPSQEEAKSMSSFEQPRQVLPGLGAPAPSGGGGGVWGQLIQ